MASVRGEYHERLAQWLRERIDTGQYTQESVAAAAEMHQTTLGGIIGPKARGTLDLDEAEAVLRHTGWSLKGFVTRHAPKVRPTTVYDEIVLGLKNAPELTPLVVALLALPRRRRVRVLELALSGARLATARLPAQSDEPTP